MITIGSLFSGIGGLELGLEWAGLGPVLWQVEKDPKCRAVLAAHWPEVERHDDVCTIDGAALAPVDLICGGFPCQDISSAGRRAGLAGARSGLWHEFARIVAQRRPRWVVVENVRSGARKYVDEVRGALGRLGYASLPIPIGASDCGAPHRRARVFIVGCSASDADGERRHQGCKGLPVGASPQISASGHSVSDTADAHVQLVRLEPGRRSGPLRNEARESAHVGSHADRSRESQQGWVEQDVGRWTCAASRIWTTEPDVARVVHGLPGRVDRERMLGNSVVPQCAEVIGHVIRKLI